ncbi:MAG: PhoH family protein [Spirochaetales bacterium]|nr:PhoH family protein [Spirochaetales bacterium]
MNTESVAVFETGEQIVDFCGPNDKNLKTIEGLLRAPIYTRGNELVVRIEDPVYRQQARLFIKELLLHLEDGNPIDPELIQALYSQIKNGFEPEALRENFISIPQGYAKVYPRSMNQALFLKGLESHELSFAVGPAGTGKTYLAIAHALSLVLSKKKRKLLLTRPVVEAGESLGFLPGDLGQKLNPYLKPLYDAMDALVPPEVVARLEENRIIEIAPLAYMRGRSLKNCYIILDEAQNTTREQMKMFLTRLGEDSQAVITGDITQIDLPKKNNSGLIHASRVLKDIPEIQFSYFSQRDVVRSQIVKKIIYAYDRYYKSAEGAGEL